VSVNDPTNPPDAPRRDRVLVLCSANQCRSPLAGAFLRREIARRGLAVEVLTAGFRESGNAATPPTVEVAEDFGLDLRAHRSRKVDRGLLLGADAVLGVERLHVREAVVLERSVWPRAFTLRDVVRRSEAVAPRAPDESLRSWLALLSAGRDRMSLMGASPEDDVLDPTTDRTVDHRTTAELLEGLTRRFVSRAWPA
jgi:protein-tyrosine phosphatase